MPLHSSSAASSRAKSTSTRVQNGAKNWTPGGDGIPGGNPSFAEPDNQVSALVVDPKRPATLYAATNHGVYKTTNSGANWISMNNGMTGTDFPPEYHITSLAIDPLHPDTLYAGTLLAGAFKTTDGGAHWQPVHTGQTATELMVLALAVNPQNSAQIVASVGSVPVYSTDSGAHWQPAVLIPAVSAAMTGSSAAAPIPQGAFEALAVDPVHPATVYAGTAGKFGILKSSDGGHSYTIVLSATVDSVPALAVDPVHPDNVYAAVGKHIQKTLNGGAKWQDDSAGLPDDTVTALAIGPANSVYAGTENQGVYKSANGGAHWQPVSIGILNTHIRALAVDPINPANIYAGAYSPTGPAASGSDSFVTVLDKSGANLVYSSYLGGALDDSGRGVALDGKDKIYLTGYTFSDNFPVKNPLQAKLKGLEDAFVTKIDPTLAGAGSLVYATYLGGAGVEGSKLIASDGIYFRSAVAAAIAVDDSGDAFLTGLTDSNDFPTTANAYDRSYNAGVADAYVVELSPAGSQLLYATYFGGSGPPPPFPQVPTGKGFDGGFGIALDKADNVYVAGETISPDLPLKHAIQSTYTGGDHLGGDAFIAEFNMKVSGDASLVYATYLGGHNDDGATAIAVSDDGIAYVTGSTQSSDFPTTFNALQCSMSGGIYKTANAGKAWQEANTGLHSMDIRAIVIDPQRPDILYAGANKSTVTGHPLAEGDGGVFKSKDGGVHWLAANHGLTIPAVYDLAIDPGAAATIYAAAGGYFIVNDTGQWVGGVFKSTDGGANWQAVNTGLPGNTKFQALAVDPSHPATLYVGTSGQGGASDKGVYKSDNGGASWTSANNGLPNGTQILTLAVDPHTAMTVYAVLFASIGNSSPGGIYKSTDGGGHWQPSNQGLPAIPNVKNLVIDPQNPATLYAAVANRAATNNLSTGVFKSTDGGGHWQSINQGMPDKVQIQQLAVDPQMPTLLYAAGNAQGPTPGLYKSVDGGAHWGVVGQGLSRALINDLVIDPSNPNLVFAGVSVGSFSTDAFVAQLGKNGSSLLYSTYFGGGDREDSNAITLDKGGNVYIAGNTNSPNFPVTNGAFQTTLAGAPDSSGSILPEAFMSKINMGAASFACGYGIYIPHIDK